MFRNTFAIKLIIFLVSIPLLSGCAGAYATYLSSSNEISIWNEPSANFTWLYKALNNDSILSHDGDIWYLNAKIRLYGSGTTFYINDSDVSELRINSIKNGVYLYKGSFKIENVTIGTWDYTTNSYSFSKGLASAEFSNPVLRNVNFKSFGRVLTYGVDGEIYNITMADGGSTALVLIGFNNSSVHNVSISNYTGGGLELQKCFNTEVYNVNVEDVANFKNPTTGYYGIVAYYDGATHTYCDNIRIHDCYVNGTGWSGVDTCSNRTTFYNLTIRNAGHNGLDIHGGNNHSAKNITVYDSVSNNIYALMPDCSFEDLNLYDCIGDQIFVSVNAKNNTFKNISMTNGSRGIIIYGSNDCEFINITKVNGGKSAVFTPSPDAPYTIPHNISFIDADLSSGELFFVKSNDIKFMNVNYGAYREGSTPPSERTFYYYPDILILDSKENPSESAKIQFTNEVNLEYFCLDANGNEKDLFVTNFNGRLSSPSNNRTKAPAIAESYRDSSKHLTFYYTAAVTTPNGRTVSLSGITPDSSWYRPDPNIPTYTITAIIPDDTTGPQITGFAPSEDNPFNAGEKKIFRVWTDENLTGMNWTVDGEPLANGTLNYKWNVTEGSHEIKFSGNNTNGNVSRVWNTGKFGDNAPSDDNQTCDDNQTSIAEFFPESTAFTKNAGESIIFKVISDQLLEKNWFINGKLAKNGTACISRSWSTPGTYNVTFSGSTCGGKSVLHTWIVDMIGSPESQNESIVRVAPEYQIVSPGKPFTLDIWIDPGIAIAGAQFDLSFKDSMLKVNGVSEGNLFSQNGASTYFSNGIVDSNAGLIRHVYGLILGESNVSSPGALARINLTAGNSTGIAEFSLSNTIISDTNSSRVPNFTNNSTVLIDTAPELDLVGSKSVDETENLTFAVTAKDTDGDNLAFSASGYPNGANFDPVTGVFTWTPSKGQGGTYTITFKVSDGYLNDSEDVKITIRQPNNAPSITSFEPANGSVFNEGDNIKIALNASDANGQALSYTIRIDGEVYSTSPSYIWNTNYSSSGSHLLELIVSDGIEETKKVNTIYINDVYPRWDVNKDGVVDVRDARMVSKRLGTTTTAPYPNWDVNQDGIVDMEDFDIVNYVIQNS